LNVNENDARPTVVGWPGRVRSRATVAFVLLVVTVAGLAACGTVSDSAATPFPGAPSPAPTWTGTDVGDVGVSGQAEPIAGDEVVVRGAGTDIYSTSDSFHFLYTEMEGDGTIVVRVQDVEFVDQWTKAGVMMRAGLEPDAPNVFVHLSPTSGTVMQVRSVAGALTDEAGYDHQVRPPQWLRLERSGSTFRGSYSSDGAAWVSLGEARVDLPEGVLIGLAVTSKDRTQLAEAVFGSVVVEGRVAAPVDPTPPPAAGPREPASPIGPALPPGERASTRYLADATVVENPERGWYVERPSDQYGSVSADGYRLVMRYVNLADYRGTTTLPSSVLSGLQTDFDRARSSGIKVVLRFAYNRNMGPDAPIDVVLSHIDQVGDVVRANADVVAAFQAGFIGAWGEWHASTNNLLEPYNYERIVAALLDEVPPSRMIQIRYPRYARAMFPDGFDALGYAFDGSDAARIGLLNDCFLTSSTDTGTYESEADFVHAASISRFTVMGGETCDLAGLNDRNASGNAIAEMARYHWDYLNIEFWRPIIDRWRSEGSFPEIAARLGYRYEFVEASVPTMLVPGYGMGLTVTIANTGFGKLYNPRPVQVVLMPVEGGERIVLTATHDARSWLPAPGTSSVLLFEQAIPDGAAPGRYDVFLWLPDDAPGLRSDSRYSIRFANQGVWSSASGMNALGLQVEIAAP
jgi:regulation of enolase protein 1 (concanavalin A-like superfamily)